MKAYEWKNLEFIECDVFAELTSDELKYIDKEFTVEELRRMSLDEEHFYFFINTKRKIIAPMSKLSYAFGGGYNGYPPYGDEINDFRIDFSEYELKHDSVLIDLAERTKHFKKCNSHNISLNLTKLEIFARKWANIFFNTSWYGKIIESEIFPYEAWECGLEMDCCDSFVKTYPDIKMEGDNNNFRTALLRVDDIQVLGNLIFSQWRWWNHWANSRPDKDDFEWFMIAFGRLIKLWERTNTRSTDAKIIGFHMPDEEYGCFSNWYMSEFAYADKRFTSVEQFMMYHKVLMAENYDLANEIMRTTDPARIKELGGPQYFHDFNDIRDAWDRYSYTIVKRGVRAKFIQNPKLMAKLLLTGDALLVECSKSDKLWGNGISISDPSWHDVSCWRGKNKMGRILMELRNEFLAMELSGKEFRYIDCRDVEDIDEWKMSPAKLSLYPEYHKAIYAYVSTLSEPERKAFMHNRKSFSDWDLAMHINMGGGLRIIGFYEMKQEIYEIADRLKM